ncbi:ABC transporter substrate-binding protein [Paenibacillus doosanensis]|uniref:Iron(3+)-hydroxamate-binding protein FhuD n=1 Tax=Paenibacillus konkukensis TaxID=2020716 RepID=A0ABY4RIY5_9BACL|nr:MULTISPECIES: ABC transporter substrate-binding protein [Paenibacillus]MCS7463829.1 ABC transporter substrate-binding protein [Paenibacillus doosanensis]UQZ81382.1 Iron(3+)-hydroxamate-binding protein FhuD precursor [Paenibacillus konkukensis]
MFDHNRTKKISPWIKGGFVLCAAALLFAGCGGGNNEQPKAETTVKDSMGHEMSIPAAPQRIIASYLEDPLLALGMKPVAQWSVKQNSVQDYLQSRLDGVPTIPSTLPPETVLSFNPDLMIIGPESAVQNGLYEQYSKIVPTYVLGTDTINDYRKTLLKMGDLLNKKEAAEQALKEYDQKVQKTKEQLKTAIGDKKVAILWVTGKGFYVVNGKVASGAVVYGDLGLQPPNILAVLPEATANWTSISLEKLAQLDADLIFLVNNDSGQANHLTDPLWSGIPAVKSGRVYEMDFKSSWLYNGVIAGERVMDDILQAVAK